MNAKNSRDDIALRLLDELAREPLASQRSLADRLGIALGLVNAYVKRLCTKGYIKIRNAPRNRIKYIITPKGLIEKSRLTYAYMNYSIDYFKDARRKIEQAYAGMIASGAETVLLWGDGELAELCYVSARGLPLEIVGVIGRQRMEKGFFGHEVYQPEDASGVSCDAVLVSCLDDDFIERISLAGIDPGRVYRL